MIQVSDLLFPSPMAAGSHAMDKLGCLDALKFLGAHCLAVIKNDHLDCQPGGDHQARIDGSLTKSCPMGIGSTNFVYV
jgi:hypothetical protein